MIVNKLFLILFFCCNSIAGTEINNGGSTYFHTFVYSIMSIGRAVKLCLLEDHCSRQLLANNTPDRHVLLDLNNKKLSISEQAGELPLLQLSSDADYMEIKISSIRLDALANANDGIIKHDLAIRESLKSFLSLESDQVSKDKLTDSLISLIESQDYLVLDSKNEIVGRALFTRDDVFVLKYLELVSLKNLLLSKYPFLTTGQISLHDLHFQNYQRELVMDGTLLHVVNGKTFLANLNARIYLNEERKLVIQSGISQYHKN